MSNLRREMRSDSRRYFERRLRELYDDAAVIFERVTSLRADLAEDGFYDDTEDSRARLDEALTSAERLAGSLEAAREQLPLVDAEGRPEPQSLKASLPRRGGNGEPQPSPRAGEDGPGLRPARLASDVREMMIEAEERGEDASYEAAVDRLAGDA